jgi:iron(III) transport system substrate-binding protein
MLGNLCKVAVIAASMTVASIGIARAADEELPADVVAAAKKEGKVAFYTSFFGAKAHLDIIKSFEAKYGIAVELLDVRASEMTERIRTEQSSKRYIADVVQNGAASLVRQQREGYLQPHGGIPNAKNLLAEHKETDFGVPTYILGYGILINKNAVKGDDVPKSWQDLKDPKWKGKIISDDPRALGGGNVMFTAFQDKLGDDYNKALAQQALVLSRDVGNDERRVARGEYPMRIPQLFSNWLALKKLPVTFIVPVEGLPYIRFDFGVLNGAPHPNAARVFINHYLSEQVQTAYAAAGLMPVVDGVLDKAGEAGAELKGIKLLGTTDVDHQNAMLDRAKQLYP